MSFTPNKQKSKANGRYASNTARLLFGTIRTPTAAANPGKAPQITKKAWAQAMKPNSAKPIR
jgi:hypothetical protein